MSSDLSPILSVDSFDSLRTNRAIETSGDDFHVVFFFEIEASRLQHFSMTQPTFKMNLNTSLMIFLLKYNVRSRSTSSTILFRRDKLRRSYNRTVRCG